MCFRPMRERGEVKDFRDGSVGKVQWASVRSWILTPKTHIKARCGETQLQSQGFYIVRSKDKKVPKSSKNN